MIYLASPYSAHPGGIEKAFVQAAELAARLMRRGTIVYSPVCHTHPIATLGGIDPYDHETWLSFDEFMMRLCSELLVAKLPGWGESRGVSHEIEFFRRAGKPITYVDSDTLDVTQEP